MGWKDVVSYSTTKIADIKSWKLGIIYYLICVIILAYVIGWAIVYKKGYQEVNSLVGYVNLKTKNVNGVAYTNQSGVLTPWDAQDVVNPPEEEGSVFLTTSYQQNTTQKKTRSSQPFSIELIPKISATLYVTSGSFSNRFQVLYGQQRGQCSSAGAPCPCAALAGTVTANGIVIDQCNQSAQQCLQESWCPQVGLSPASPELLYGVENFTIFAKVSAKWPEWGVFVSNYNGTLTLGYNLFTLGQILEAANWTYSAVQRNGAVIMATAHYDCNFDLDTDKCQPQWSFLRIDAVLADSNGSNYYAPEYYNLPGPNGTLVEYRTVWKWYGVNIVFQVNGQAGKFNIVPLLTALGSGIGLLAVATVVVDILVLYIHPKRRTYAKYKVEYFEEARDEEGSRKPLLDSVGTQYNKGAVIEDVRS